MAIISRSIKWIIWSANGFHITLPAIIYLNNLILQGYGNYPTYKATLIDFY